MKNTFKILFLFVIITAANSCTDKVDLSSDYLTAVISAYDYNTNTCIISISDNNAEKLLGETEGNQYNTVNLPISNENLIGKVIKIKARAASENEIPAGITLYASSGYPYVYITDRYDYYFNYNDTVLIPVNSFVQSADKKYIIKCDSVLSDSRCPLMAECVWAGTAEVRFTFSAKDYESKTAELFTVNNKEQTDSTNYNGLKIKLLDLIPYPESYNVDYKSYKAKILIQK